MKKISFKFNLAIIVFIAANAAFAGDKVGNGGGVWACKNANDEIFDVMFIDIYEGIREHQLTIPELTTNHLENIAAQKIWIKNNLPQHERLLLHIEYVEKNITWIDEVLTDIPDVNNNVTPHPSTCKQGKWSLVQMVNFTTDFRILVRKEIFNSPYMSELERSAVYFHEGIYSYLRTEFGDTDSKRARKMVGYLFSNLDDTQKSLKLMKIFEDPNNVNPIDPKGWVCGVRPGSFKPLYIFEALTKSLATKGAVEACKKGEDPFHGHAGNPGDPSNLPGFPGGPPEGFPGFPGGLPGSQFPGGPGADCKEDLTVCEEILTTKDVFVCELSGFSIVYVGKANTLLAAQKNAEKQCFINGESYATCQDGKKITCKSTQ